MRLGRLVRRTVPLAATLALAGGCTQLVWFKPGTTDAQRTVVEGQCLSLAYARVPPAPVTTIVGGGYVTPMIIDCDRGRHGGSCVAVGGTYVPPSFMTYDANRGARNEVFSGCMYADGWTLQKPEDIAKAREPDRTRGFDAGVKDRAKGACDTVPPDIQKPEDWRAGCLAGQVSP
jgi:hypothetical protein